jgi:peptide/nickel transport system substrate-binding protein
MRRSVKPWPSTWPRWASKVNLDVKPKSIFFDELSEYKHRFYLIGWFDGSFDFGRSAEKLLHTPDKDKGMGAYNGTIYSEPGSGCQ